MPKLLDRRQFIISATAGLAGATVASESALALPTTDSTNAPITGAPDRATSSQDSEISLQTLMSAEKLADLPFTSPELEPLVKGAVDRAKLYTALRTKPIPNALFPALNFEPKMAGIYPRPGAVRTKQKWDVPVIDRPVTPENLAFFTVHQLARLLREGRTTSRELTEISIDRIKRFDPALNAVITLTKERALRQADTADNTLKSNGPGGLLLGIPWGIKDMFSVKGYPTTWGAHPFRDQYLDKDAEVVQRLDQAGAVLVAKLSLGALAGGDKWFRGQTKCPWNLDIGADGSSAGPAAAVSAGIVPFAIGSETFGSLMDPCTRNGVSGLRPSYGRISRFGVMNLSWSMDKVGPVARSAEDLALVFDTLHGADSKDPTAIDAPFDWQPISRLDDIRIGFKPSCFEGSDERDKCNQRSLEILKQLGAILVPIRYPEGPLKALGIIQSVEAAAAFDDLTLSGEVDHLLPSLPNIRSNWFRGSRFIPAVEYVQANRIRTSIMHDLEDECKLSGVDVWVAPSENTETLILTNLTGHPAVCVLDGLIPVNPERLDSPRRTCSGIAFMSRLYRDELALAVAAAFQQATTWHLQRPPIV